MKIRTLSEIREFEEAVNKCTSIVWLTAPNGDFYNLKSEDEYVPGITCWANDTENQTELFASNYTDEEILMNFVRKMCA